MGKIVVKLFWRNLAHFLFHILDLQTVENKVNQHAYSKLSEFVGDITRIFENCRLYNHPTTQVFKCSQNLESFFAQKLVLLREKILTQT